MSNTISAVGRLAFGPLLVGTLLVAGCGSAPDQVTRTTTTEERTIAQPAPPPPPIVSTTTTTTDQVRQSH
jgi:hypothetical protein